MANCCENKGCEISAMRDRHSRVLWVVLVINAVLFLSSAVSVLRQAIQALYAPVPQIAMPVAIHLPKGSSNP
jgi:hypothetical protein